MDWTPPQLAGIALTSEEFDRYGDTPARIRNRRDPSGDHAIVVRGVEGVGFRVWGSGFWVLGSGFSI